ncbi:hypothetical protein BGX28_004287, partial [Mortierella sp. GBA30]
MVYQYAFQPQPQPQPQSGPLLDAQNNPTRLLISFANAVFDWLDIWHAPKGSRMLEPEKMDVILALTLPNLKSFGYLDVNMLYLACSIETVFTASGPAVTRTGFLSYLRFEITSLESRTPEQSRSGKTYKIISQLLEGIQEGLAKILQQEEAHLKQQAQKTKLLNMATRPADAQFARNASASERMGWIGTANSRRSSSASAVHRNMVVPMSQGMEGRDGIMVVWEHLPETRIRDLTVTIKNPAIERMVLIPFLRSCPQLERLCFQETTQPEIWWALAALFEIYTMPSAL